MSSTDNPNGNGSKPPSKPSDEFSKGFFSTLGKLAAFATVVVVGTAVGIDPSTTIESGKKMTGLG